MRKNKTNNFERGLKLSAQSRYVDAVKAYEQVTPNDPNFLQAQMNLKWISYWTGSVHDEYISQDQNRWKPGTKQFTLRLRRK